MDVVVAREAAAGLLRLDRPKALHSLNLNMCRTMLDAMIGWRDGGDVQIVMIDHAEGRGFCAGGDIRMLASSGQGDGVEACDFFRVEYQLNHLLFTFGKPTLAFLDGVTMGGGVGISQPCRYRVATENTRFAMPESGIGLFPDVGGGWYLSRLPGRMGAWLALTGGRLDGAECFALGIATHYIPAAALDAVKRDVAAAPCHVEAILDAASIAPPPARLLDRRAEIDRLFAADRYEDILAALREDGGDWASDQLAQLATKSNMTCKVSLRQLAEGAKMKSFADEMRSEYRIATRICRQHDFIEGVRALLIDKDNKPQWRPASPEGVSDEMVAKLFAPLDDQEEWRPV